MFEDAIAVRRGARNANPTEGCFFLDDKKVTRDMFEGVLPETVERVEVYKEAGGPPPNMRGRVMGRTAPQNRGGVKMIRVYTKRYVATLPRQETLARISYTPGTMVSCA
jgi:hypothetical protein